MHATDRAAWRAALLCHKLPLDISSRVLGQRNRRISTLLAAVMNQPVLADIQIPSTCTAPPVIRLPIGNRLLKVIEPRVTPPRQVPHLVPHAALRRTQRLQLPASVMN